MMNDTKKSLPQFLMENPKYRIIVWIAIVCLLFCALSYLFGKEIWYFVSIFLLVLIAVSIKKRITRSYNIANNLFGKIVNLCLGYIMVITLICLLAFLLSRVIGERVAIYTALLVGLYTMFFIVAIIKEIGSKFRKDKKVNTN